MLSLADFAPRLGEPFAITVETGVVPLVLAEAAALPDSGRSGGSFRLEFAGPLQPALPQAIYAFPLGEQVAGIFIVPVGPLQGQMRYEAIFF